MGFQVEVEDENQKKRGKALPWGQRMYVWDCASQGADDCCLIRESDDLHMKSL